MCLTPFKAAKLLKSLLIKLQLDENFPAPPSIDVLVYIKNRVIEKNKIKNYLLEIVEILAGLSPAI